MYTVLIRSFEESNRCEVHLGEDLCKVTYHKVTRDGSLDERVSAVKIAFPHRK